MVTRGRKEKGNWMKVVKRYKFPVYKINKQRGYNIQHDDYS